MFRPALIALVLCTFAFSTTITKTQSPIIDKVVEFVRANGGFVSDAISVQDVNGSGVRGMVALRDLAAGEKVFHVPGTLSVTEKTAEKYLPHSFLQQIRFRQCSTFFPSLAMVSFLAVYRRGHLGIFPTRPALPSKEPGGAPTPQSEFEYNLFFASFPQECDMPVCLTGNRTETLYVLSLVSDLSDISFVDFRDQYLQCLDGVYDVTQKATAEYDYTYVTLDDLIWGFHTADSRAWSSTESCGEYTTQASSLCGQMIPYADLINHQTDAPQITTEGYYTDRPIKAGQELFLTYGQKSPWEIYKQYGFFIDKHDDDAVNYYPFTVSFHTEPDSPFSAAKASLLEYSFFQSDFTTLTSTTGETIPSLEVWHKSNLKYDEDFSPTLIGFLRVVHATWDEFAKFCMTPDMKASTGAGARQYSLENEMLVYEDLLAGLNDHIQEAWSSSLTGGTWEADLALAKDMSPTSPLAGFPLRRTVIRERGLMKRIVYNARDRAQKKLNELIAQKVKKHDEL